MTDTKLVIAYSSFLSLLSLLACIFFAWLSISVRNDDCIQFNNCTITKSNISCEISVTGLSCNTFYDDCPISNNMTVCWINRDDKLQCPTLQCDTIGKMVIFIITALAFFLLFIIFGYIGLRELLNLRSYKYIAHNKSYIINEETHLMGIEK